MNNQTSFLESKFDSFVLCFNFVIYLFIIIIIILTEAMRWVITVNRVNHKTNYRWVKYNFSFLLINIMLVGGFHP